MPAKPRRREGAKKKAAKEPQTPVEWQEAADAAEGAIVLDSWRQYGLVTGGPKVNVERCQEILAEAKRRGVIPAPDAVEQFALALSNRQSQIGNRK